MNFSSISKWNSGTPAECKLVQFNLEWVGLVWRSRNWTLALRKAISYLSSRLLTDSCCVEKLLKCQHTNLLCQIFVWRSQRFVSETECKLSPTTDVQLSFSFSVTWVKKLVSLNWLLIVCLQQNPSLQTESLSQAFLALSKILIE